MGCFAIWKGLEGGWECVMGLAAGAQLCTDFGTYILGLVPTGRSLVQGFDVGFSFSHLVNTITKPDKLLKLLSWFCDYRTDIFRFYCCKTMVNN